MISDRDSSDSYQTNNFQTSTTTTTRDHQLKGYDYLLKFLLVGDPDVGKDEIMNSLDSDVSTTTSSSFSSYEQHFSGSPGVAFKSTQILLDGKRIRLQLWYCSSFFFFSFLSLSLWLHFFLFLSCCSVNLPPCCIFYTNCCTCSINSKCIIA